MRTFSAALFLAVALNSIWVTTAFSQQDTTSEKSAKLILKDGTEYLGFIIKEDSLAITFKTVSNISMTIPREQVKTLEHLSGHTANSEYIQTNPNDTRLLFAPTARSLGSGQGYFAAYQIFFPFIAVGVADFMTVAGGISLIPGVENQLFYLAPKITPIQKDEFSVAGGLLYINSTSGSDDGVGIFYGVTTYGSPKASFTFGLGWGFYGIKTADKPIILIGGEFSASNSIKLITENWFPPNSGVGIFSFGIRFIRENLSADLGLIYPAGSETTGFPFIPWLGLTYNFGTAKL